MTEQAGKDISTPLPGNQSDELRGLELRTDDIDAAIIHLLSARFAVTQKVGELKAMHQLPARAPEREAEKIAQVRRLSQASGGLPEATASFFQMLMDEVVLHHLKTATLRPG